MRVEGSYSFCTAPETVLKFAMKPQVVRKCLPDCRELRIMLPDKCYYQLYGYKGILSIRKLSLGSWIPHNLMVVLHVLLSVSKMFRLKVGASLRDYFLTFVLRSLKRLPSPLNHLEAEIAVEGKGSAGSIKGKGHVELELRASDTLVKYRVDIWLSGLGALLQIGSASPLDLQGIVHSLFKNLDAIVNQENSGGG